MIQSIFNFDRRAAVWKYTGVHFRAHGFYGRSVPDMMLTEFFSPGTGNPSLGFPTAKPSTGRFGLPS